MQRIYSFKDQLCDYAANFALTHEDGVTLSMRHPILLDTDIIWLTGVSPTQTRRQGDTLEITYIVEKILQHADPSFDIPVTLLFTQVNGRNRLKAGHIDSKLSTVLTPELIDRTLKKTCDATSSIRDQSVRVDLSALDRSSLPTRKELIAALGEPLRRSSNNTVLYYAYRLKDANSEAEAANAIAWYDARGQDLRKVKFRYLRYELNADFVKGSALIKIHL